MNLYEVNRQQVDFGSILPEKVGFMLSPIEVKPEDVFIITFPLGECPGDMLNEVYKSFRRSFPENQCIFMPDNLNIQICSKGDVEFEPATHDELYEFLNINNPDPQPSVRE